MAKRQNLERRSLRLGLPANAKKNEYEARKKQKKEKRKELEAAGVTDAEVPDCWRRAYPVYNPPENAKRPRRPCQRVYGKGHAFQNDIELGETAGSFD